MKIKRIEIHLHGFGSAALAKITNHLEHIMSTQEQLIVRLNAINATITKVGDETRSLLTKIEELVTALANVDTLSPEVDAAVSALAEKAAEVDALVADLVPVIDPEPVADPDYVFDTTA